MPQGALRWVKLAIMALELVIRLLSGLPRLRKEAREAIQAAALAYATLWNAVEDRELTRDEVAQLRDKVQAVGHEVQDVAKVLAEGSPTAIRWTKLALNNWLRAMGPTFDASATLEMLGFGGPDVKEGVAAIRERRSPRFGEHR